MNYQDDIEGDLIPKTVIELIIRERERQIASGRGPEHDQHHSSEEWIALITKHIGKAVYVGEREFKLQMIRVAALAIAAHTAPPVD